MIWLAIALVGTCAVCWDLGVVLQKRAADALPPLVPGSAWRSTLWRFLRSPGWMGGLALSGVGYALFAIALSFTPVSVARSIQGLGFVVLALMSVFFLNHRLSVREWLGVLGVTGGVLLLGLSAPSEQVDPAAIDLTQLALGVVGAVAVCVLLELVRRGLRLRRLSAVVVSFVSGTLLGLGDVLTRALLVQWPHARLLALTELGPPLVLAYVIGFLLLSRAYQHGRALVVTGVSDLAARLVTLVLGMLAMNEALPPEPGLRAMRVVGFAAIFVSTAALAHLSAEGLGPPSGAT